MRKFKGISLIIMIVLPAVVSCRAISSFLSNDEVVAKVGKEKLYRSDLEKVVPKGISPHDSSRLASQYIFSWASDRVYLTIAEQQLSKSEKDVARELEDYRKSLLKYRYEQLYVNERLDTAVSQDHLEEYYQSHQDRFVLQRPIVKARFLNISADSPNVGLLRRKMSSDEVNDLIEADSIAFSSAVRYTTWAEKWIDAATLAREYSADYTDILSKMNRGWIEVTDTLGYVRLSYVHDMMNKGKIAPLEYCAEEIKDIIISTRRQNLVMNLERDLLNEALENGEFVIY